MSPCRLTKYPNIVLVLEQEKGLAPKRSSLFRTNLFVIFSFALALGAPIGTKAFNTPAVPPQARTMNSTGPEFELDGAESEVLDIVRAVAEDPILRGTYVYENAKTLTGARPVDSSPYFGPWTGPGHVFYKVLTGAIAPRHFKDSSDIGTITIRYVVLAQSASQAHLRIDAVFLEEGHHKADISDGSVESSEFKEIQERLRQVQLTNLESAGLLKKRQEEDDVQAALLRQRQEETVKLDAAESSLKDLESRFNELQHKVIVRVRTESTELKSAPFNSATKVQFLSAGAELAVLIVTPAWYGVETADKHRGWLRQVEVEALP